MRSRVDVDPERFQVVMQLLAEFPELDVERVRALLESPAAARRRRAEPVRPRSWSEINTAVESGWVTKNEARKYAGLRQRTGPQKKPKASDDAE
jgi:hypothetical protein